MNPRELAYGLPFEAAGAAGISDRRVTQSVKLAPGQLQPDRYFVRVAKAAAAAAAEAVAQRLQLPAGARVLIRHQLGGFGQIGAFGAACEGDRVIYRVYLRSGIEKVGRTYGVGIDWAPGGAAFAFKEYRLLLWQDPPAVESFLAEVLPVAAASTEEAIRRGWLELLGGFGQKLQLLEVADREKGRCSFDAGPLFESSCPLGSRAAAWRRLAMLQGIESSAWEAFLAAAQADLLENLAIGRDGQGRLFLTAYHRHDGPPRPLQPLPAPRPALPREALAPPVYATGRLALAFAPRRFPEGPESALSAALAKGPDLAEGLSFYLEIGGKPAYGLSWPAAETTGVTQFLREALAEQELPDGDPRRVERVSLAGRLAPPRPLADGSLVPSLELAPSGLSSWSRRALLGVVTDPPPQLADLLAQLQEASANPGLSPHDRTLNFAATQAGLLAAALRLAPEHRLLSLAVQPRHDPVPFGERWDLVLTLAPAAAAGQRQGRRRVVLHFDVGDVYPVPAGPLRSWPVP